MLNHRMRGFRFCRAVAPVAAAVSFLGCAAATAGGDGDALAVNLHRVRVLFDGSARAVWVGDSWCLFQNAARVPYGSLLVWPVGELDAVCAGFRPGVLAYGADHTAGEGAMVAVNPARQWRTEFDSVEGQQHFALPLFDVTQIEGRPGLVLDRAWPGVPRMQTMYASNAGIGRGDLPPFARAGDDVRCRVLYYAPRSTALLAERVLLADGHGTPILSADLRLGARGFWHLGEDADGGPGRPAAASQINAVGRDVRLDAGQNAGPMVVIGEDSGFPIVGSGTYWDFAGAVYYHAREDGSPRRGFYHSGLSGNSWSFGGMSEDRPSDGGKTFSDAQLLHWLDVSTLDRSQTPVVILHMATEARPRAEIEASVRTILDRFRAAFARIGVVSPRFLLVGSYMHRILDDPLPAVRGHIRDLDSIYRTLALTEPDCAFFSLYEATDGVFLTSDAQGGPGAQQTARDWLDAHGWSSIEYGGSSHVLSSAADGGLDGVLVTDGIHCGSSPAAAFFAKLLGDAISTSHCPGDFNADGRVNTQDVVAFLNAWVAGLPEADVNSDGRVNSADVIAFLNMWNDLC